MLGCLILYLNFIYKFLQFLGMFGDAQSIKKADDRHAKLFMPHKSKSEFRKRHAEDSLTSDKAKLARPYGDATSTAVMAAYPNAPNQWAAGYGVQPQAWPSSTQPQPQQWAPGYGQQVYLSLTMLYLVFYMVGRV